MFVFMSKKKHAALLAKVEAAKELVTLIDSSFVATDSHGRIDETRNKKETNARWERFWFLDKAIHR